MNDALLGSILIMGGVLSDVTANIFLKKSVGFKYKKYGIGAILFVIIAFVFLANALTVMELSVAYALFGGLGLLLTTLVDKFFFAVKLNKIAVSGIFILICGVILLKTA